ncbi:hypothetical protein OU5_0997 [Pseudomonas mandelii JR-1]|uniref:Uncharacterized protein n=1 Tax=Pseudomonas mandelii JR-1 TaxID=1147786 RepID=A0A024E612_9PSED|nr:hypothetical protein OU5_0997 [Pseudomonas mandelii JR-1]
MGLTDEGALPTTDKTHSYFFHGNTHRNVSLFEAVFGGFSGMHPKADVTGYIVTEI